jgi:hypothetical protein
MSITLSNIKNKSKEALDLNNLRQLPISIRDYFHRKQAKFDNVYDNRDTDAYLQRFKSVRYPIADRLYGSPNEEIANIFLNMYQSQEILDIIDEYIFNKQWIYHPVRKFDKWTTISELYYGSEEYFWTLLLFNKIADPFQDLLNFNMIRVPHESFTTVLPYRTLYDYQGARFK